MGSDPDDQGSPRSGSDEETWVMPAHAQAPQATLASEGDRYQELGTLGRGGIGEVASVFDRVLERSIARKVLRAPNPDPGTVAAFLHEARITAGLEHPGIVPVYDLGIDRDGRVFYTMRRVSGRTLAEVVAAADLGPFTRRIGWFVRVCDAVAFAHARGVIHRDLKPSNVLVGEFGEVVVVDWGLARRIDDAGRASGVTAGTPMYMAPEQVRGEIGVFTDVYALGALLYVLLTGSGPHDPGPDLLERVAAGAWMPVGRRAPGVPHDLAAVAERALAKHPTDRYPTVQALQDDLRAWQDDRLVSVARYGPLARATKYARRNRRMVRAVLATATMGAVALAVTVALHVSSLQQALDRAVTAEHAASARLADARIATALALAATEPPDVPGARSALADARVELGRIGASDLPARLAESWVDHRYPPPALTFAGAYAAAAVGPAHRVLIVGEREALLYDALAGRILARRALPEAPGPIAGRAAAFVSGRPLVAAWSDGRWEVADLEAGAVRALPGPASLGPFDGAHLPSGSDRVLITTASEGTRAFDAEGAPIGPLVEGWALAVSPDGRHWIGRRRTDDLFQAADGAVVWAVDTGAPVVALPPVEAVAWSADGRWLVFRSGTTLARVEIPSGEIAWRREVPGAARVAVADDRILVLDLRMLRWLDARTGEEIARKAAAGAVDASAGTLVTHPEATWAATVSSRGVQLWSSVAVDAPAPSTDNLTVVEVSGDGALVLSAGWNGVLQVHDRVTGALLRRIPLVDRGTRDVALSPDASRALSADRDGGARVVDLATGAVVRTLVANEGIAMAATFLPSGDEAVVAYQTGVMLVWDLATGTVRERLRGALGGIWDVALDPSGRWLVATGRAADEPLAEVWDLASGRAVRVAGPEQSAYRAAFAPQGSAWAVGSHSGTVWLFEGDGTGVPLGEAGTEVVMAVAFSPDGALLAVGRYDGSVELWEVAERRRIGAFPLQTAPITDLRFVPDSRTLIAAGSGGYATLDLDGAPHRVIGYGASHVGDPAELVRLAAAMLESGDASHARDALQEALARDGAVSRLDLARAALLVGDAPATRAAVAEASRRGEALPGTLAVWATASAPTP